MSDVCLFVFVAVHVCLSIVCQQARQSVCVVVLLSAACITRLNVTHMKVKSTWTRHLFH